MDNNNNQQPKITINNDLKKTNNNNNNNQQPKITINNQQSQKQLQ